MSQFTSLRSVFLVSCSICLYVCASIPSSLLAAMATKHILSSFSQNCQFTTCTATDEVLSWFPVIPRNAILFSASYIQSFHFLSCFNLSLPRGYGAMNQTLVAPAACALSASSCGCLTATYTISCTTIICRAIVLSLCHRFFMDLLSPCLTVSAVFLWSSPSLPVLPCILIPLVALCICHYPTLESSAIAYMGPISEMNLVLM